MLSSLPQRRIVLLGLLGLAGCGFAPVYGTQSGLRDRVSYVSDDSVAGFQMRQELERRLGRSTSPAFVLTTRIRVSQRSAAITPEGDTSRFNLIGMARWTFADASTGETIERGTVEAFTSFSATSSTVATQATEDDALKRLMTILADMIVSRLLALDTEQSS